MSAGVKDMSTRDDHERELEGEWAAQERALREERAGVRSGASGGLRRTFPDDSGDTW